MIPGNDVDLLEIPAHVRAAHEGWTVEKVWELVPGVSTFRLVGAVRPDRFLKVAPARWYPGVDREAERMRWAEDYLPVPQVVESGSSTLANGIECQWLITVGLPGRSGVHTDLLAEPEKLTRALARGLRRFHGAPVAECPFDFRLGAAMEHVRARVEAGSVDPGDFHEEFADLTPERALARLERSRPTSETLVVCHGDYCPPNSLIEWGRVTGFLDLGELGVADRWWDLAVATWALEWNLGPGYEALFLDEYGVRPDPERAEYYRLLYDLAS
jgi:kanamycin kinase